MTALELTHARRLARNLRAARGYLHSLVEVPGVPSQLGRWERFNTEAISLESRLVSLIKEEERKGT